MMLLVMISLGNALLVSLTVLSLSLSFSHTLTD